jgi:hypothetical protein
MRNKINEPMVNPAEKENTAMKTDTNISASEGDIRKRAYEICLERGNLYAPPETDWLKAEAELRNASYKRKREKNL